MKDSFGILYSFTLLDTNSKGKVRCSISSVRFRLGKKEKWKINQNCLRKDGKETSIGNCLHQERCADCGVRGRDADWRWGPAGVNQLLSLSNNIESYYQPDPVIGFVSVQQEVNGLTFSNYKHVVYVCLSEKSYHRLSLTIPKPDKPYHRLSLTIPKPKTKNAQLNIDLK